jgi:FkbM family methyltransferase
MPPASVPNQTRPVQLGILFRPYIRLRAALTPFLSRHRHALAVRVLVTAAGQIQEMARNMNFDLERNGELAVLHEFQTLPPSVVFDVGANVGDWSERAAALFPGARIHAFEIVPDTARVLAERLRAVAGERVTVNALGLSDASGQVTVAYSPGFSEGSSAALVQAAENVQLIECPVSTGDSYCAEHGIECIDLLKVDVEGLEKQVLAGFADMLSRGAVRAVQFEYGRINASVRFLLGDFYDLFGGYGFEVGKIYPDGVEFKEFDPLHDENFTGPNFLAVHRSETELIAQLRSFAAA